MSVVFIARDKPTEVLEPADRTLDLPAASESPELATVLGRRLLAVLAVRTNEFDAAASQAPSQRITIPSQVIDQPTRLFRQDALLHKRFDQRHFVWASAGDFCGEWKTAAVGEDHGLGSLATLRLPDAFAPFFAEENVP